MSYGRGSTTRGEAVDRFEAGAVAVRFGIVSGFVTDLCDVLDCTPDDLLDAVEQNGVVPFVDTVRDGGESHDPPTDPALRCLAFTERDFRALAAAIGAREATEGDSVPAEIE